MYQKGMLVVMSGPSGAGKGTLCRALLSRFPRLRFSVSATTRRPRKGEQAGKDYLFLEEARFLQMVQEGAFLEWAKVYGNFYGTPRVEAERLLSEGFDVLLDIDTQGAIQVRERCPEAVLIFVAAPSQSELEARLRGRGTESEKSLERRLSEAKDHMAFANWYDYIVINDGLEVTVDNLHAIMMAEKLRVNRQHPEMLRRFLVGERGWHDC